MKLSGSRSSYANLRDIEPSEGHGRLIAAIKGGISLAIAGLVAHSTAAFALAIDVPILAVAIALGLTFGSLLSLTGEPAKTDLAMGNKRFFILDLVRAGTTFGVSYIGLFLLADWIGGADALYCDARIPASPVIAIVGAYVAATLTRQLAVARPGVPAALLVQASFCWIAPFFGYFSAPIFLALRIFNTCPGQTRSTLYTAAAMLVAEWIGVLTVRSLNR